MLAKRSKRLSPAKKHTKAFIKQRITFYSTGFHESKKQMSNALNEKEAIKSKLGERNPSTAETERLEFLSYVAGKAKEQANQYSSMWTKWKNKKEALFSEEKK